MDSMPRLIDSGTRTDNVVIGINWLMATGGPRALTLRAIAREVRISPASLLHHFDNLDRLLGVAAFRTAEDRLDAIRRRQRREGVLAFLPGAADDLVFVRAWLGWLEMWRSYDVIEPAITENRRWERALLAETVDHQLARDELDALRATIDGLTVAICAPERPLALPRAREILASDLSLRLRSR
jgi:AcrR family transcriptional regulator